MSLQSESKDNICCSEQKCGCDDKCVDQLAKIMCASDDDHIHPDGYDSGSVTAFEDKDDSDVDKGLDTNYYCEEHTQTQGIANRKQDQGYVGEKGEITAENPHDTAHHRSKDGSKASKGACGGHKTIARRQVETLASFGCICKALIARGLQGCCATKLSTTGQSIHSRNSSRRAACTPSRKGFDETSITSVGCWDKGGVQSASRLSLPRLKAASHVSIASSCHSGFCCGPGGQDGAGDPCCFRSPVVPQVAVDSDCKEHCCGHSVNSHHQHGEDSANLGDAVVELSVRTSSLAHAVLAVKGMTCTGCENKLIRTLHAIPGICNIKTGLVLTRAEFDYKGTQADLQVVIQAVEQRTGFSVEQVGITSQRALDLLINTDAIGKILCAPVPRGVSKVAKISKQLVRVTFDPRVIGARSVLAAYGEFSVTQAPEPRDPILNAGMKHIHSLFIRTVISAALTIPILIMTWAPLPDHHKEYSIASLVLASIVQTCVAGPFYPAAFKSLFFSRIVETDLLIVLSTSIAYVYSVVAFAFDILNKPLSQGEFFETSTLLVTLIMVGQLVSAYSRHRAVVAISLRSLQWGSATLVHPDGKEEEVDGHLLHFDDVIKVGPDTGIITDGVVTHGQSEVDESMMTGESIPVPKNTGDVVIAGTANGPSVLHIKVTRLPGDNTINDIADLVDSARFSRARVQATVDKVCGYFVPCVFVVAVIVFAAWTAIGVVRRRDGTGKAVVNALTYAIAVLAISCPCAIGLAVPMVILVASGVAAKKMGLVFKSATTIEEARKVTHAVFDKTGTLTTGRLSVVKHRVFNLSSLPEGVDSGAAVLALVESSKHPVARAVGTYLTSGGAAPTQEVKEVEMVAGHGIRALLDGVLLLGGNPSWLNVETHPDVDAALTKGYTMFCVTLNGELLAVFSLSDTLRPEAHAVLTSLRAQNIEISILSGDHAFAVDHVATQLSVPTCNVRAGCLPKDKQAYIKGLTSQGQKVLFCGDGTNDAIALAQASIGVHMSAESGSNGAGIAASSAADVVLLHPSLTGILSLLSLSRSVHQRIVLNFTWSFIYNLVAVLFASGAFVNVRIAPAYAGLGEMVSVIPVIIGAVSVKWVRA
ncbi:heavy metal translocatin [Cristinia sonorae]|uniref:Heavy metal translocatin n=1 Tax=Cristinia sonorae TaxID=1940300 RepID=A0A8K0USI0_9AGAR|nr:heavy metal translocatin [Cristinia sonorae]